VTGASYLGLVFLTLLGYPTIVGVAPGILLASVYFLLWAIFFTWSLRSHRFPTSFALDLAIIYGIAGIFTFVGYENWGGITQNVTMAFWDLACALCFVVE